MNEITTSYLINNILQQIKTKVEDNMRRKGRFSSGKTVSNMEITMIDDNHGQLLVPSWFEYIEKGSAPAPRGTQFYNTIHDWAKARNIISDDSTNSRKISGAIAHTIITKGTKAYQIGGEDIFTSEVNDILEKECEKYMLDFKNNIQL